MSNIKIQTLKAHPEAISALIKICYEQIYQTWAPEHSKQELATWFDEWMNDNIPLAFVALVGNEPIGMCSLQLNDGLPSELKPWLGDLCVTTQYQGQGVGKKLIDAAKYQAKKQGYQHVYLYAPNPKLPQYYKNLGWEIIGKDHYHDHPVTVMKINL